MIDKGGRPTKYKEEFSKQAEKLCLLGATDMELADFFEVSDRTIYRWQTQHPGFCQSLKAGKSEADDRVERSLYHRAVGYTFQSEKIVTVSMGNNQGSSVERVPVLEHVPPDTTAMIFWLKNRRAGDWRDKIEMDANVKTDNHVHITREVITHADRDKDNTPP